MGYAELVHKACSLCNEDLYGTDASGLLTWRCYGHGRMIDGVRVFSMCAMCDPNPELHRGVGDE